MTEPVDPSWGDGVDPSQLDQGPQSTPGADQTPAPVDPSWGDGVDPSHLDPGPQPTEWEDQTPPPESPKIDGG